MIEILYVLYSYMRLLLINMLCVCARAMLVIEHADFIPYEHSYIIDDASLVFNVL